MLRYRIYQIHPQSANIFKDFCSIGTPDPNDYGRVYDGFMPDEGKGDPNEKTDFERLEKLFYIFNMRHPQEYHARSMSVSDIVEIYDENSNRYYFCDTIGFVPLSAFDPVNVNPPPEHYTLETLIKLNSTSNVLRRITQRDVDIANECVEAIRRSRSDAGIQSGDIVELTTKHGDYYRDAHIESYDTETDRWSVCEKPMTPYVTVKRRAGIQCDTSGGPWSGIPNNLKLIGKRIKMFWVFGSNGMCAGGGINFQAEVNVWEYKQDAPIFGDYTTKNWAKHYISYCVDENGNPRNGQYRYTSSGFALEAKEDYDAWLKTYRGVEFKGNLPNQTVIFCYREKTHYVNKSAWDQIDLPMDTRLFNGIKLCKVGYNDETHVVDVYMLRETTSLNRLLYKPYELARGRDLNKPEEMTS